MYGASSDNSFSICSNEGNHKNSKGQWIGGEADDEKRPGYNTDRYIKSNNRRLNGGDHMLTTITAITTGVVAAAAGEVIKEIMD